MQIVIKKGKEIKKGDLVLYSFEHLLQPAKIIKVSRPAKNGFIELHY